MKFRRKSFHLYERDLYFYWSFLWTNLFGDSPKDIVTKELLIHIYIINIIPAMRSIEKHDSQTCTMRSLETSVKEEKQIIFNQKYISMFTYPQFLTIQKFPSLKRQFCVGLKAVHLEAKVTFLIIFLSIKLNSS